eukprot:GHVU01123064.1.p2 GENE.GHVU01123064.1~~GHVU01123064.1.p2  ORF type:complete len:118 (+),score=5.77 GHVU01123064.1:31-384(+)
MDWAGLAGYGGRTAADTRPSHPRPAGPRTGRQAHPPTDTHTHTHAHTRTHTHAHTHTQTHTHTHTQSRTHTRTYMRKRTSADELRARACLVACLRAHAHTWHTHPMAGQPSIQSFVH